MQTELTTNLILLGLFALIAVGIVLVSRRLKLVSIPEEHSYSEVSGVLVLLAFGFYFGLFKVVAPLILFLSMKAAPFALDISTTVIVNLSFIWLATLITCLMTLAFGNQSRRAVWSPRKTSLVSKFKAVALSPIYYLIAFPWILVIQELYIVVGTLLYGEPPQILEQSMVTFLKQILPFPILFGFTAFTVIVIVPIQEEILFRGLLQRWLSKKYSITLSVVVSSLLFSVLHFGLDQGFSNLMLLPTLFCFSLFLGLVYEKQGTLWASIALHSFFNGLSIVLMITNWASAG